MTTKQECVEGIILKKTPYKDNDAILHVFTKEYGKIGIHARGIQKITSKNAASCQEMIKAEMMITLRKGLSALIKGTPIERFRHVHESIEAEIVGHYVLEYFYRYSDENVPDLEDYNTLSKALEALNNGYSPLLVYLIFSSYILKSNGVSIDVDGCVICGAGEVVSISSDDGGFLCEEHRQNHPLYDIDLLKAFRHINKCGFDNIDKVQIQDVHMKDLVMIMDHYRDEYSGISLKTQKFIKQIV